MLQSSISWTAILRSLIVFWSTAFFGAITVAVRKHFKSEAIPLGMWLISVVSIFNIVCFETFLWAKPPSAETMIGALPFYAASGALFGWAVSATRPGMLRLAFDDVEPTEFTRSGPYRYIRHPFYSAYILFWLGCAVVSQKLACVFFFAALTTLYVLAAFKEEAAFQCSPHSDAYKSYKEIAGLFWPKRAGLRR